MKLQITDPHGQAKITVPKKFVQALDWKDGQELDWKINDKGNLELKD